MTALPRIAIVLSVGMVAAAAAATRSAPAHPTYSTDVAPIIRRNCATCHRPGEVAPFPLLTYRDVSKRARQIAVVTESRFMPPWKADSHSEFVNERRLTDDEIATIKRWTDSGAPEGSRGAEEQRSRGDGAPNLANAPGAPDVVFAPEHPYALAAEGADVYRCFVVPTHYSTDRWVSAVQVAPGNRAVVHHVLAFVDISGRARELQAKSTDGPGYSTFGGIGFLPIGSLGGWAPGNMPHPLPAGVGMFLPKGADIVLQVHYHKDGKPEQDLTRIGLYFCKGPVDKRYRSLMVFQPWLHIPAGDAKCLVTAASTVRGNATVLDITPHMHLLGREMTVTAHPPAGPPVRMVHIPDWDFNWQTTYTYRNPLKLPAGTRIDLVARYDNSDGNPRNPSHPPKPVRWGEQTTDEMCIAFVGYTLDSEHLNANHQ